MSTFLCAASNVAQTLCGHLTGEDTTNVVSSLSLTPSRPPRRGGGEVTTEGTEEHGNLIIWTRKFRKERNLFPLCFKSHWSIFSVSRFFVVSFHSSSFGDTPFSLSSVFSVVDSYLAEFGRIPVFRIGLFNFSFSFQRRLLCSFSLVFIRWFTFFRVFRVFRGYSFLAVFGCILVFCFEFVQFSFLFPASPSVVRFHWSSFGDSPSSVSSVVFRGYSFLAVFGCILRFASN